MNPLVRGSDEADATGFWKALPPVVRRDLRIVARPEAKILVVANSQNVRSNDPIYLARSVGGRKALLFAASGLWQWNMHRADDQTDPLARFLIPGVRWLSTREEEKPLRVAPVKGVFSGQEPVEFIAQLYDETLQPLNEAEVRVRVRGEGGGTELLAQPLGSGRYRAVFEGLGEGTYAYSAQATAGEIPLGTDRGSFSVGKLTVEYQDVRPNLRLLEQLAVQSGGRFFQVNDLNGIANAVTAHPDFVTRVSEHSTMVELWNTPGMLVVLVALLASEWLIRKRRGML